mgnify:CR=1 FL=1
MLQLEFQQALEQTQQKIAALQGQQTGEGTAILTDEQRQTIDEFRDGFIQLPPLPEMYDERRRRARGQPSERRRAARDALERAGVALARVSNRAREHTRGNKVQYRTARANAARCSSAGGRMLHPTRIRTAAR